MSLLIITIATPSRGQAAQQPVDFRLGADVDAARRLVDDQHLRPEREPLREHHLLLVAAAQGRASTSIDGALTCSCRRPRRRPAAPRLGHEAVSRVSAERRSDTFSRIEKSTTSPRPAILGNEEHPVRIASSGSSIAALPSRLIVPAIGGSTPKIAGAISDRRRHQPGHPEISPRPTRTTPHAAGYRRVRSPSTRK
jgi:hypothetical protein